MTGTISFGIHSEEFLSKINLPKKTHRFPVYFHKLQNESLNIYRKNTIYITIWKNNIIDHRMLKAIEMNTY